MIKVVNVKLPPLKKDLLYKMHEDLVAALDKRMQSGDPMQSIAQQLIDKGWINPNYEKEVDLETPVNPPKRK